MLLEYHGQYGSIEKPGYDNTAKEHGYIMVYLQGMGDGNCGTGWNTVAKGQDISETCTNPKTMSGSCCYDSCKEAGCCTNQNRGCRWATCADDVKFTQEVISAMQNSVQVGDIFSTGGSNGGMMQHNLMTSMPTTYKAVVPVYGLPLVGQWEVGSDTGVPHSLKGTSVLYMHGRNDQVIPVKGGLAGGWYYESEKNAMKALAEINGCSSTSSKWQTPYDGLRSNTACVKMDGCPNGLTIAQCLYDGAHGAWPTQGNDLLFWWLDNYGAASEKVVV
jgi:poly(3-hydroxybutyrate) depolymerase